jgi:uncharacterized membrane protein
MSVFFNSGMEFFQTVIDFGEDDSIDKAVRNASSKSWWVMAFLALLVASYALAISIVPAIRPPLVRSLFVDWPAATFAHFIGGAIALMTGALQVNAHLRVRFLEWHRWTGRLYLIAVAAGGVAGFVLALDSFAGPLAQGGFALLAVAWIAASTRAYVLVRQGDVPRHRDWMIRSYALTLAAVTLRIYLPASQVAGIPFMAAYPAIAWLCWVPNLLVAEWLVRGRRH